MRQSFWVFGIIILILIFPRWTFGQKSVGVVLSGGGAKGLTHIGVLKALEKEKIPVDYVVGTSMGAIIGGMYAAGYTPDEMEKIALTPEFQRWVTGVLERKFDAYFYKREEDASLVNVDLSLDSNANSRVNSYLVNDAPMNFALNELVAAASAKSTYDFDKLLVPFRCVASDVFGQTQVVISKGSLADALKASSTVPLIYTPIKINNKYLFDGGIYNNFPADVMQKEFQPDIIIGVNVSTIMAEEYPYGNDEKIANNPLKYFLVKKTDPSSVGDSGVFLQPNLKRFSAFEFSKAKDLIDSGFACTIRSIAEIKRKVGGEVDSLQREMNRQSFKQQLPPLVFDRVEIKGLKRHQENFVKTEFPKVGDSMTLAQVKKSYFNLVNQGSFQNIYPRMRWDSTSKRFAFGLDIKFNKRFSGDLGVLISSRNVSYLYLGLNFKYIRWLSFNVMANAYLGRFYQSFLFRTKIDFPYDFMFNLEPEIVVNSWNYFRNYDFYFGAEPPKYITQIDRRYGLYLNFPFISKKGKASFYGGYIFNQDFYANYDQNIGSNDTPDQTLFDGAKLKSNFTLNTLNRKQYATSGNLVSLSASYFVGNENYKPGSTAIQDEGIHRLQWYKLKLTHEKYFNIKFFSVGYMVEGVYSNQPMFSNYRSTLLVASSFTPLQDGKTFFLENYRSISYLAGGGRMTFQIVKNLDLRLEGYIFSPFNRLLQEANQKPGFSGDFLSYSLCGGASVIYHTGFGPLALVTNYYQGELQPWGVFVHFGYLLFNSKSLE